MASKAFFDAAPPFPNDIPTISMNKVRLAGLQAQDAETEQQLFTACQDLGFFFLDLQGDTTGDEMIKSIDELFRLGKDIFNLPEDVKQQYLHDAPKSFLGFKNRGEAKTETNEPDRFEWFNMGQDGLMGNADLQRLPPFVLEHIETFKSFMKHSQKVASVVNHVLAKNLSLPEDALAAAQRPSEQSGTVIRLIKAFASPE
ncbi:hypothetical protein Golomagni_05678 [Golovinomyces magnicellulatus]|nr:hypothetical protein Golomagni_05678 [Golovinomyces magnicellulatus]